MKQRSNLVKNLAALVLGAGFSLAGCQNVPEVSPRYDHFEKKREIDCSEVKNLQLVENGYISKEVLESLNECGWDYIPKTLGDKKGDLYVNREDGVIINVYPRTRRILSVDKPSSTTELQENAYISEKSLKEGWDYIPKTLGDREGDLYVNREDGNIISLNNRTRRILEVNEPSK